MDRRRYFHPPQPMHFVDRTGAFHLRPFVRETRLANPSAFRYEEIESEEHPIRFFVRGSEYTAPRPVLEQRPPVRRRERADLSARHRFVRARRVLAAALRRAGLADGRPRRHPHFVHARPAARRDLGLLRRDDRLGDHAQHGTAPEHSVALSDHRAARGVSHRPPEPAGLPRDRGHPRVHRVGGSGARDPRSGAVDQAQRVRDRRRGARA